MLVLAKRVAADAALPHLSLLDDREAEIGGDRPPGIDVARMQPGAAAIERHAEGFGIRPGAPADAVARLDAEDGQAALDQGARRRKTGGTGPDHRNVTAFHGRHS